MIQSEAVYVKVLRSKFAVVAIWRVRAVEDVGDVDSSSRPRLNIRVVVLVFRHSAVLV